MTTQSGTVTETRSAANRALLAKALEDSALNLENKEYLELRRRVAERGLLDRQYGYYATNILAALAALAVGVAVIILADQLWVRLTAAAFMAAVLMQFNFIGHDAGHRQIFRSARYNDLVLILAGFVTGITQAGGWRSTTPTTEIRISSNWTTTSTFRSTPLPKRTRCGGAAWPDSQSNTRLSSCIRCTRSLRSYWWGRVLAI